MGWKLNLQYGHVILVSKHPVLTAVSWPQHGYHSRNTGVNGRADERPRDYQDW